MKRFLLPVLLCITLFLSSCGKSRGEGDYRAFAERLNAVSTLSFTAQVRAEYEHKTARFTLAYEEDGKRVVQLIPDDGLRCSVWFDKADMRPLRAELITDGRVTVYVELSDWTEG